MILKIRLLKIVLSNDTLFLWMFFLQNLDLNFCRDYLQIIGTIGLVKSIIMKMMIDCFRNLTICYSAETKKY